MRVLFTCYGNAYRSPLAEALLKKLRPDIEVDSAGLHVAIPISREVKDYLRQRDAVQYLKDFPQSINEKNLRDYDLIVTMELGAENAILAKCRDCQDKIVGWDIMDPYFMKKEDVIRIFNEIENKVKQLVKSL